LGFQEFPVNLAGARLVWENRPAPTGSGTPMAGDPAVPLWAPVRDKVLTSAHPGTLCPRCDMRAVWGTAATNPVAEILSNRGESPSAYSDALHTQTHTQ